MLLDPESDHRKIEHQILRELQLKHFSVKNCLENISLKFQNSEVSDRH